MNRSLCGLAALVALPMSVLAGAYDIGAAMEEEAFWKSDPVLFVKRQAENGFQFTSESREGADSRLDGGVTCYGIPVFESKVAFGEEGGIARVELMLYAPAGTETVREFADEEGRRFRQRVRVDKTIGKDAFGGILKTVAAKLTKPGAKQPKAVSDRTKEQAEQSVCQSHRTWPRTALGTQATLTWNYRQEGKRAETFEAGFIRLAVGRTARAGEAASERTKPAAKGAKKISDNVVRDPRGDVFIDGLPMVDQGQKGYCSVATAERVLRYYGVAVDEHEVAQAAGTTAEGGTNTKAMKDSVEAVGKRYKLGTVVCYGDFDKDVPARIAGLGDEVRAYNKAAKKLKKPAITDDMYIRREGNTVYYSPSDVDAAMDAEVLKEMKTNGSQKSKFTKFMADVRQQVDRGVPLFWGVKLGIYPEPGLPQAAGGHMRLVIGYNDKKKEILYTDSWGAGHELKRMPADWAWTISHCLLYMKPLSR